MLLFHGSNQQIEKPVILSNLRALDFGKGFYLTSNKEQAYKWAKTVCRRRQTNIPYVNIFEFDLNNADNLQILHFDSPDGNWLDFVVSNRKELNDVIHYDLVIGPVANDSTLAVIDDYMDGRYTRSQAIERLLPQKLTDQYAFCSQNALQHLHYISSESNI